MVLEKTLESPLEGKEIKPVNLKGNQPWIFIGRADAEAPTLWPPDGKSRLIGKYPDVGKDWGQEEKGATEDEMVGWHHQLNGHESDLTPGDTEGQGSLWLCCRPWGHKELDTTEWLNNSNVCPPGWNWIGSAVGTWLSWANQILPPENLWFMSRGFLCVAWTEKVWTESWIMVSCREKQKQTETKSLWQKREESKRGTERNRRECLRDSKVKEK